MIARPARWIALASAAAALAGCDVNATVPECTAPDAASPVTAIAIAATEDPPSLGYKAATISIVVSANIPCLRGGTAASLTTSTGTVGGNMPGNPLSLFLAPTGDAGDTHLEGYTDLVIPYDRVARVDAAIGEATAIAHFGPFAAPDGGVGGAGGATP
jgi:hypothetical protein